MKETDYINAYAMALAQFNLNQLRNENEMLKTTAGMTAPIPAYNFLPMPRFENIGSSAKFSDCFEPVNPPEDDDYKRGFLDGWVKCTDYFIKHESNKEGDIYDGLEKRIGRNYRKLYSKQRHCRELQQGRR